MRRAIVVARARVLSSAVAVGGARAGRAAAATAAPKVKVERSASGQKIFRITEGIVVEGKIQKPNAFYVLQRSSMDYDWESLKQDFLPKILRGGFEAPVLRVN